MFSAGRKSLAIKLICITGGTILLLLVASTYFMIAQTRERVFSLLTEQAGMDARAMANYVARDLGALSGSARTLAEIVGKSYESEELSRSLLQNMIKGALTDNSVVSSAWFIEAKDHPHIGPGPANDSKLGSNENGNLTMSWRSDQDGPTFHTFGDGNYTEEWYTLAANSRSGALTEPYLYEDAASKSQLSLTSITYPVISNGQLVGVAGTDVSLELLSTELRKLHPFEDGRVMLLSQSGKWIVGETEDAATKDYNQAGAEIIKAVLQSRNPATIKDIQDGEGNTFDRYAYPFTIPGANTTWVILVDVPHSAFNAPVRDQTLVMVVAGTLVLTAAILGLFFAVRTLIQKPLGGLVRSVTHLSDGHYDNTIGGQEREDEIGAVARALEGFRYALANTKRLEAEANSQRGEVEADRIRAEDERRKSINLQRQIVSVVGAGLSELSHGNLGHRINEDFPGEYAQLKEDFNATLASLEKTIATVNLAVMNIGSRTGEISEGASDLAKRTEQQAAGLEETAAALNELAAQVNSSAENARTAAGNVNLACEDAEKSGEVVRRVIASMQAIAQSSMEVSRIISVIDDIAFQTNLLALNAGVEAARAGEAGKGFAVVAQEVRELAQRSANAAKEIKTLINSSGTQVNEGVELVGSAGSLLQKISEHVMGINSLVRQISASADEQAIGLREINQAMTLMDQVTQQNAGMVEQATAGSATLNDEAQMLKQLLSQFQVAGTTKADAFHLAAQQMRELTNSRDIAATPRRVVTQSRGSVALAKDHWEEF